MPPNREVTYSPKKSRRASIFALKADGDIWIEHAMLVEGKGLRSYFESKKTGKCVWDEPPSGASKVVLMSERPSA